MRLSTVCLLAVSFASAAEHEATRASAAGTAQTAAGAVPSGMVALFASRSCPSGWEAYQKAQGRMLIAVANSAESGVQLGEPLIRRDVPVHRHFYQAEMRYSAASHPDELRRPYDSVQPGTTVEVSGESESSFLQAPFTQVPVCKQQEKD